MDLIPSCNAWHLHDFLDKHGFHPWPSLFLGNHLHMLGKTQSPEINCHHAPQQQRYSPKRQPPELSQ